MQNDGRASNTSYAIYAHPLDIDFRELTICFWFSLSYLRGADQAYSCMLTFATRNQPNYTTLCKTK